jgi:hypothetical protein
MTYRRLKLRLRVARTAWWLYFPLYIWAVFNGLLIPDAIPAIAGVPLLITAAVFAACVVRPLQRLALGVLGAALVQLGMALLLLGGKGRTWHFVPGDWVNPPGMPQSVGTIAWFVAALLPIAIAAAALRGIRRGRVSTSVSVG